MLKIFYGDNRVLANNAIRSLLGENYEVIEGPDINAYDMPNIFMGVSLFAEQRNILIRDLTSNKSAYEELIKYVNTPHNIILLETKIDKRSITYKDLKDKIEFKEFVLPKDPNLNLIFDIYGTAKRDGKKAIEMLNKIKSKEEPNMFFGLIVSQELKNFPNGKGTKKFLKELSRVDMQLKSAKVDPWLIIEAFLLRLSSLS